MEMVNSTRMIGYGISIEKNNKKGVEIQTKYQKAKVVESRRPYKKKCIQI